AANARTKFCRGFVAFLLVVVGQVVRAKRFVFVNEFAGALSGNAEAFGKVVGVQPPFPLGDEFDAFEGLTLLVGDVFHDGYCSVIAATMTIVIFLLIDNINGVRRVPRFQRNQLAISTKFSLSRYLPGDQPSRTMTKS